MKFQRIIAWVKQATTQTTTHAKTYWRHYRQWRAGLKTYQQRLLLVPECWVAYTLTMFIWNGITGTIMTYTLHHQPTTTYCVGRLLIDLPANAVVTGQGQEYGGHDMAIIPGVTLPSYQAQLQKRVEHLKKEELFDLPIFAGTRSIPNLPNAGVVLRWDDPETKEYLDVDGYYWFNDIQIKTWYRKTFTPQEGLETLMVDLGKLFAKIKPLPQKTIPQGVGFCMESTWIPDQGDVGSDIEAGSLTFELKDHPDVQFLLSTRNVEEPKSLLTRHDKLPTILKLQLLPFFTTLERGKLDVGPFKGEILAQRIREPSNLALTQQFVWESIPHKGTVYDPVITFEMKTGYSDQQDKPINSSLSDGEARAVWDKILHTIRVRPVDPAPTTPDALKK